MFGIRIFFGTIALLVGGLVIFAFQGGIELVPQSLQGMAAIGVLIGCLVAVAAIGLLFVSFSDTVHIEDSGEVCIREGTFLYRWYSGWYEALYNVMNFVDRIVYRTDEEHETFSWNGHISGCNMIWLLTPIAFMACLVMLCLTLLAIGIMEGRSLFDGVLSLPFYGKLFFGWLCTFVLGVLAIGWLPTKIRHVVAPLFLISFLLVPIGGLAWFAAAESIATHGLWQSLVLFFTQLFEIALMLGAAVITVFACVGLVYAAFRYSPYLARTPIGRALAALHAFCPTVRQCGH